MSLYTMPRELEEALGRPGADALAGFLQRVLDEEKRDVMSRIDEKVTGRYEVILRRVHEDIAGAELRLDRRIADVEVRIESVKTRILVWLVGLIAVQGGFMVALAWASKRLF